MSMDLERCDCGRLTHDVLGCAACEELGVWSKICRDCRHVCDDCQRDLCDECMRTAGQCEDCYHGQRKAANLNGDGGSLSASEQYHEAWQIHRETHQ